MAEPETFPVIFLRWVDSANLFGDHWSSKDQLEEFQDETYCLTLGFLVEENDHSLFVAGSMTPTEIGSVMQIPKVSVVERRDLGDIDLLHGGNPGGAIPWGSNGSVPVPGLCP